MVGSGSGLVGPSLAGSLDLIGVSLTRVCLLDLRFKGVSNSPARPGEEGKNARSSTPKRGGTPRCCCDANNGPAFLVLMGEERRLLSALCGGWAAPVDVPDVFAGVACMLAPLGVAATLDFAIMLANLRGMVDAGISEELEGTSSSAKGVDSTPALTTSLKRLFAGVALTCTAETRLGFLSSVGYG